MNSTLGVDVVVPSYNHAPYVERTLRSIFRQSLPPATLLVIDDGSVDDSPTVVARVLKEAPFPVELKVQRNQGLCATLNRGLSFGSRPYFAYIGSDDMWHPDFLRDRVATLEKRADAVLAYGHAVLVDAYDRVLTSTEEWSCYVDGDARRMLLSGEAPSSASVAYRRSELEQEGWLVSSQLEDYDLYLRLSARGGFAFEPAIRSAWRRHDANTSLDVDLMVSEALAAQRRHAGLLRLNKEELAQAYAATRFRGGHSRALAGDRWGAWCDSVAGLRGAPSKSAVARRAARLLAPRAVQSIATRRERSLGAARQQLVSWGTSS